jgi:acyl-coenzyme A synthetase/AMP-(fatty) acid ligase
MNNFFNDLNKFYNRIAVVTEQGDNIRYKTLITDGSKLMDGLETRHLMFLVCKNCLESVCVYIGALRKGVVPILINAGIDLDLYKNLLSLYKPSYIFSPKNWCIEGLEELAVYGQYSLRKTGYTKDYEINDDLALLLTTSGSTGSPKLVRQSYTNLISNADSIAKYLEINEADRAIMTMPMSYTYGLSIINSHLLKGARVILNEYTIMNKEFWELLKEQEATTFGGVPYIYEMLKKLRFGKMSLPSLKYLTQAGGKLSKEMAEEFNEISSDKGIKFIIMYGQTEATARMSYLPWSEAKRKAGSMGIAIPGGEFFLIDENNEVIAKADTVGELVYKGENVTLGYAENCYDLIKGDENKGVLHTGDMAKRDEDGFYYIVGRKKRFLKLFGNRINLDEMEGLLKKKGYDCVCSGNDDKLKIYVTSNNDAKEIVSYISSTIGIHPSAFEVKFIEEIQRNESGKVMYSALN